MKRLVLIPLVAFLAGMPVQADVASRSADGLGTRINGSRGGRCSSGLCLSMEVLTAGPIVFIV